MIAAKDHLGLERQVLTLMDCVLPVSGKDCRLQRCTFADLIRLERAACVAS
jgi:hypothetical protein